MGRVPLRRLTDSETSRSSSGPDTLRRFGCDMSSPTQLPPRAIPELPYFTLDLHRRTAPDAVELILTGDLDALTVGHLDDSLDWVVGHMTQPLVVVDLSGVRRLDSCGVETLTRVREVLHADGRTLTVRGESASARAVLTAAGLVDAPHPSEGG
jgi:anti-anti-sigma factor